MGDWCAMAMCTNYRKKTSGTGGDVSYFRFPRDPKLKKAWVSKCYRADKFNPNTRTCTICSCHFKEADFERDLRSELLGLRPRKILIKGAIPSQNLPRDEQSSRLRRQQKMLAKALKQEHDETSTTEPNVQPPFPADIPIKSECINIESVSTADPFLLIEVINSLKSKLAEKDDEISRLNNLLRNCKCIGLPKQSTSITSLR